MNPYFELLRRTARNNEITGVIRVLGIDLGTTNSTAAVIEWDPKSAKNPEPRCVDIEQRTLEGTYVNQLLPSMIALEGGEVFIGEGAKRLRADTSRNLRKGRDLFWECKNDIGLERTYGSAPQGYRSAREIGGHLLKFLAEAARDGSSFDRTAVTVPASFQNAQRRDTLGAARIAGLELVGGDLIDEPISAFLDYLFTGTRAAINPNSKTQHLLVFDFGGGTCDVAVFGVKTGEADSPLQIFPKSVSRYHRLGGGDIDAAIVHNVLIPQIRTQNGLGEFDLGYLDKKQKIEPAFLGVAEALKISLCREITRLKDFGKYSDEHRVSISVSNPGSNACLLGNEREVSLKSPTLNAEQLAEVLKPFLDEDILAAKEGEYFTSNSIFGPISDALERIRLDAKNIDYVLLVGGSSLIPQVREAVDAYFKNAKLLAFDDPLAVQTAIARGGAYHALFRGVTGESIIRPIAGDGIFLRTNSDPIELIPANVSLPFPDQTKRKAENMDLTVPKSSKSDPVELRIELLDSNDALLARHSWNIPAPVKKGDGLNLKYRMDENQELEISMSLAGKTEKPFEVRIENPLTHVVNPSSQRLEIERMEEDFRNNRIEKSQKSKEYAKLAKLYSELGHHQRALELLKMALKAEGSQSGYLYNRMGMVCADLGDYEKAEKFYRKSAEIDDNGTPMFNLALALKNRGESEKALNAVEVALASEREAPYLVLKAMIANQLKRADLKKETLDEAFEIFGDVESMGTWELSWYIAAAKLAGDRDAETEANAELKKRRDKNQAPEIGGELPQRKSEDAR